MPEHYGKKLIQIDGIIRTNAKANLARCTDPAHLPFKQP